MWRSSALKWNKNNECFECFCCRYLLGFVSVFICIQIVFYTVPFYIINVLYIIHIWSIANCLQTVFYIEHAKYTCMLREIFVAEETSQRWHGFLVGLIHKKYKKYVPYRRGLMVIIYLIIFLWQVAYIFCLLDLCENHKFQELWKLFCIFKYLNKYKNNLNVWSFVHCILDSMTLIWKNHSI